MAMQERITSTKNGSITSVQAVYVPADDLTDPAPATTFAHLDATTVLSRKIAEQGIYPAVDPLDSTSITGLSLIFWWLIWSIQDHIEAWLRAWLDRAVMQSDQIAGQPRQAHRLRQPRS